MRESKPWITQSAAYIHFYDNSLYKKLVRGLGNVSRERAFHAVYKSSSRLTNNLRLIFPRTNRTIVITVVIKLTVTQPWNNRAVYTRENKAWIKQSAAYLSRELSHLYEHGLHKKLIRGLRKPRMSFLCRLYEQFAAYNKPWIV